MYLRKYLKKRLYGNNNSMTDYYAVLGIPRNAKKSDIKKAFHKLSLMYHPDKYTGEESKETVHEKYQNIKNAYDTLSDPDKRKMYDKFGKEYDQFPGAHFMRPNNAGAGAGSASSGPSQNQNPFQNTGFQFQGGSAPMPGTEAFTNLFEKMFNNNRNNNSGNNTFPRRPPPGEQQQENQNISHTIRLSFAESYTGVKKEVNIRKKIKCGSCKGRGTINTEYIDDCDKCSGQGVYTETKRLNANTVQQTQKMCDVCKGRGSKIREGRECKECEAKRFVMKDELTEITIPAGVDDDFHLDFNGHGHMMYDKPGNLVIVVKVGKPPKEWERVQNALNVDLHITLKDAMCGFKKVLRHLDGRELLLICETITQPHSVKKIPEEGFKDIQSGKNGDLHVRFIVDLPTSFDKTKLKEALPLQESVVTHDSMKMVLLK